jgi:small subunit ribosomal protein S17
MKQFKGTVVSDKMDKTIVVLVESDWTHPKYKKTITKTQKYLVHDEKGAKIGDSVVIQETKPISKRKKFILVKVEK